MDAEFGADRDQRARDVGRAQVDVVGARQAVLRDRLLEAVLLVGGPLGEGEVAVREVARRAVDLREQVGLAQPAVGRDDHGPVQRGADPQVAGVLVEERPALGRRSARWPGRGAVRRQQPVDARARERAHTHEARPLEHPDDATDRAPGLLALGAQDVPGDLGANRAALAPVRAVAGMERREATAGVGVVPGLDRASGKTDVAAVGPLVRPSGGLVEVAAAVAVLEPSADQRTQDGEPPERHGSLVVVLHGPRRTKSRRPFLGGSYPPP